MNTRLARYRPLAVGLWCAGFAVFVVWSGGIPLERTTVLVCLVTLLAAVTLGRESLVRLLLDFVPLILVLVAYTYLRGVSDNLGAPVQWHLAPDFDRALFGAQPVVWLQQHLDATAPRWWDVPVTLVYCSFFVVPWIMAAVLWKRDRGAFRRWTGRWVAMSFAGFALVALVPAAPPWAAARCRPGDVLGGPADPGCIGHAAADPARTILGADVHRISWFGFDELHVRAGRALLQTGEAGTDLVAAVPSLHAAGSLLITMFLWPRVRRGWRVPLALYPPAMAFALMYTANHYAFDVLTGWALALAVWAGARAVERRLRAGAAAPVADPAVPT